ncbi:MAG TPA: hypothetical protein VJH33_01090 [Candidatus Paceibacterota bacterium]
MTLEDGISRQGRVRPIEHGEERIAFSALRYRGEIFTGANHGDALIDLEETHPDFVGREVDDGFTTSSGRFVDRVEAYTIARSQGQLKQRFISYKGEGDLDSNYLLS